VVTGIYTNYDAECMLFKSFMQRRVVVKTAIRVRKCVDDGVISCLSTKVLHVGGDVRACPELRSA